MTTTESGWGAVLTNRTIAESDRCLDTGAGLCTLTELREHRIRFTSGAVWLSEDPKGFDAGDANLRRVVGNSPTNRTDSSGLQPFEWVKPVATATRTEFGYLAYPAATRKDSVAVLKGTLSWELSTPDPKGKEVEMRIQFTPSKDNTATVIGFIQVVLQKDLGEKPAFRTFDKETQEWYKLSNPSFPDKFTAIDVLKGEDSPYYAIKWDGSKWVARGNGQVGNGPSGTEAKMSDGPQSPNARSKKGVTIVRFETAVFAVDTQEVLGVVKWGYAISDDRSDIRLLGARRGDVSLSASDEFLKVTNWANRVHKEMMKHAQLDGKPYLTLPKGKTMGGTGAISAAGENPKAK